MDSVSLSEDTELKLLPVFRSAPRTTVNGMNLKICLAFSHIHTHTHTHTHTHLFIHCMGHTKYKNLELFGGNINIFAVYFG